MEDIILYIFKKYGILLTENEAEDLLVWFEQNKDKLYSEEDTDKKVRHYLYNKYKGRPMHLFEEDLSNMKYLLTLLKKENQKKNK